MDADSNTPPAATLPNNTSSVRETLRMFCEAHAFCVALSEQMPSVLLSVPSRDTLTEPQKTVYVLAERAASWMSALARLDRPTDYQAQSAACRAMLELVVDVVLVASEPTLAERMWAWEESAKLKSCLKYRAYVEKVKLPHANQTKLDFIKRNEQIVLDLRRKHWGTEKHPPTWFGKPFDQVTAEADRRANATRKPGHVAADYEETYAKNYDELCWGTHGSSLAIIRTTPPPEFLPSVAGRALTESSRLALDLTERAADFVGLDGEAECDRVLAAMKARQESYRARLLDEIGAGGAGIPRPQR